MPLKNSSPTAGRRLLWRHALMALMCLCLLSALILCARGETLLTLQQVMLEDERVWRYVDDPARLSQIVTDDWISADYDDGDWLAASGSFGAYRGRRDEVEEGVRPNVCLRHYLPSGSTVPVYYFRLPFSVASAEDVETMCADVVYDDAVIIYLNGTLIYSGNVPSGGYATRDAYGCLKYYDAMPRRTVTLDRSLFIEGENILSVELHQSDDSSSDVYFSMGNWRTGEEAELRNETLCLDVGRDETQVLITWRGPMKAGAHVQVMPREEYHLDFTDALQVPAEAVYEADGIVTYRAALNDLLPGEYLYRAVDTFPTDAHSFSVQPAGNDFFFLCHGDAQIVDEADERVMEDYLLLAEYAMAGKTPQLILSLGDQVDEAGNEAQYRRLTGASLMKEIPLAAVVGNHESASNMFSRTFSLPNMKIVGDTDAGSMAGDYWFFRGNTLFFCLNSNIRDIEAHREFLTRARAACIEEYGTPRWIVAAFHHGIFSAGKHGEGDAILTMRGPFAAMLEEVGVDVVLNGHDHAYTRSWPMDGDTPLTGERSGGIVYFTLGSSTGSKFYSLENEHAPYAAFTNGEHVPAMSRVDVTDDTLIVTTYQLKRGNIVLLDTFTLINES